MENEFEKKSIWESIFFWISMTIKITATMLLIWWFLTVFSGFNIQIDTDFEWLLITAILFQISIL